MADQNSTTTSLVKLGIHSTQEIQIFLCEDGGTKH